MRSFFNFFFSRQILGVFVSWHLLHFELIWSNSKISKSELPIKIDRTTVIKMNASEYINKSLVKMFHFLFWDILYSGFSNILKFEVLGFDVFLNYLFLFLQSCLPTLKVLLHFPSRRFLISPSDNRGSASHILISRIDKNYWIKVEVNLL